MLVLWNERTSGQPANLFLKALAAVTKCMAVRVMRAKYVKGEILFRPPSTSLRTEPLSRSVVQLSIIEGCSQNFLDGQNMLSYCC